MPTVDIDKRHTLQNLATFDVTERLARYTGTVGAQILFAFVCTFGAVLTRFLIDLLSTGAGPFAVTIPATLIATLFGRALCGVLTQILSITYMWYFALPEMHSFVLANAQDAPRIVVNLLAGMVVVGLGEIFRQAVRSALHEREMFLGEMDHRVKNNFASIAAVLRLQGARSDDENVRAALDAALGRVESYATAHQFLYQDYNSAGLLQMQSYLTSLCAALSETVSNTAAIEITCDIAPATLPRDRAIAVGLLVNELVTNSAKHAFADRQKGRIAVSFHATDSGYRLIISDDGRGITAPPRPGSLGLKLVEGLARQALAELETRTGPGGTHYEFALQG